MGESYYFEDNGGEFYRLTQWLLPTAWHCVVQDVEKAGVPIRRTVLGFPPSFLSSGKISKDGQFFPTVALR